MPATSEITYEQFCEAWVDQLHASLLDESGADENGATTQAVLRREFVRALLAGWMGAEHDLGEDFIFLDDGATSGIDAFFLESVVSGQSDEDGEVALSARVVRFLLPHHLPTTGRAVLQEAAKIRRTLSEASPQGALAPLLDVWRTSGAGASVEIVFASVNPLPAGELESVGDAEATFSAAAPFTARGSVRVSAQAVSLHTLYARDYDDKSVIVPLRLRAPDFERESGLLIGAVTLLELYEFLKEFRARRGDIAPLYEKNVRVFLKRSGKVNKGISATLRREPENFGLYNNGITLVSRAIALEKDGTICLTDPSVVNGCQTTSTLWETLCEQLKAPPEAEAARREAWNDWRRRLELGRVVVKIVRVAPGEIVDDDLRLENITRFTNSQNAVKDKDFIALDRDFRRWKRELALRGVFLEILRNEGTAQIARQKSKSYTGPRYERSAKAFELFKIYGAGWMNEPGDAWNKNAAFVPKGAIFKSITSDEKFGGDELMAALHLQSAALERKFGKTAFPARSKTKFLFYRTFIELLRGLLKRLNLPTERAHCTLALLALQNSSNEWRVLADYATDLIDDYMNEDSAYNVFKEPTYEGDFNAFFKKTALAKTQNDYPQLWNLWTLTQMVMKSDAAFMSKVEPVMRATFAS